MPERAKLTFCSGTGVVTGANFLLEIAGLKILIDCGMIQGNKMAEDANWEPFTYDPATINALIVTHGHVDHIGRIPKLVHDGFRGTIYSTHPTKEISEIMLQDTAFILSHDREHDLKKIYNNQIISQALGSWKTFDYHETFSLGEGLKVEFSDAGHILGSATVKIEYRGKTIVFTGDLGNSPSPLLRDTEMVQADYLVTESVYGDRNHDDKDTRRQKLVEIIQDAVKQKGALVIPIFSLERSQELLFEINDLIENNRIPLVPFFLDSPLAIKLTAVFKKYSRYFNERAQKMINSGNDIFMFPGLRVTLETEESKMIVRMPNPKIIIAGSGMSTGGRIIHHEHNHLPDPKSIILLIGYQSMGTLGRKLQEGVKRVRVAGEEVSVRARVAAIDGYSGHKDSDGLLDFIQNMSDRVRKIFVVMGEPRSSLFLAQKLRDYLGLDARAPIAGESVELEF